MYLGIFLTQHIYFRRWWCVLRRAQKIIVLVDDVPVWVAFCWRYTCCILFPQVIWKGVQIKPLYNYLRRLQIRRTENLQPVKLIYIGHCGSGKTTLNRTLATGKCVINPGEEPQMNKNYLSASEKSNLMKRLPRDSLIEDIEEPNR